MKRRVIILLMFLFVKLASAQSVQPDTVTPLPVSDYISIRDGLPHFYNRLRDKQPLTVAFLGGSITYNPGWRDSVTLFLKKQYPGTVFHFIAAGIPSLGSLPHAFRLQQDVLDSGRIDLLFVEAAVNDRVNETDSLTQVRDLEGILRHARKNNPETDIVFLSFADPDKTNDYDKNITPVEVKNHELVADYYHLPSINLAKEVHDKMHNGEFSWENDFKDLHPSPFGQNLYYEAIKFLLEQCSDQSFSNKKEHDQTESVSPLNDASFSNGNYVLVDKAESDSGWVLMNDWTPSDSLDTRPGFVHVPMLVATKPGASLHLRFTGNATGIAIVSGADAGMISYAVDNEPSQTVDTYTQWSHFIYLPWYLMLRAGLPEGNHILHITVSDKKNEKSKGYTCRIVHFLVNE